MAVVCVYDLAVYCVLYPYSVALAVRAVAAGPATGGGVHVERLPVGGAAVAEHVVNAAVLGTPIVHPALGHGDARVREREGQEVDTAWGLRSCCLRNLRRTTCDARL